MNKDRKRIIKKGDVIIFLLAIFLAGVIFIFSINQNEGDYVNITVNGKVTTYALAEDKQVELKYSDTVFNTIIIKNGEAFMDKASCPDQICVHHKAISKNGESIICLPNEVYVEVKSDKENVIDN